MKKKDSVNTYRKLEKNIYEEVRNGHKSYKVIYKNKTRKRFKTYLEAQKYRLHLVTDDSDIEPEVKGQETYVYFADKLMEYLKENKKISTYETKKAILDNIIIPNFEDKPICKITKDDCYNFRSYIGKQNYATNYKNAIIVVFKQVFNYAQEYYDINIACVKKVKRFGKTESEKIEDEEKVESIWEPNDFKEFIKCVDSKFYKTLFTVSITSWARIGEVQALRWSAYDGKSIRVYRNIVKVKSDIDPRSYVDVSVKTNKGNRIIDLPIHVCELLNEMKEKQKNIPGFNESWYIFNRWDGKKYKDGTYPIARTCIDRAFRKGIKSSGVKRIRIHDLRASGATHAILSNEDIKAVSVRLGHADINTTLECYHHAIAKARRKVMTNASDFISSDDN